MSKNYTLSVAFAASALAFLYPKTAESSRVNVPYEQASHSRALESVVNTPLPQSSKPFKNLERRVAEFDFADIVGYSVDPDMDYTFVAYDSGKNVKYRGKLHSKKEIMSFLDTKDYSVLRVYKRDKGVLHENWTIKIERIKDTMMVTYDTFQFGEHGKIRFLFESLPDEGSDSVMKIWNTLHGYIGSVKRQN